MELLKFLEYNFKGKCGLYIFTSGNIQEAPEIRSRVRSIFGRVFSADALGVPKSDPQAYNLIIQEIGIPSYETLFIDDGEENLRAAQMAGFKTLKYTDNKQLMLQLKLISL